VPISLESRIPPAPKAATFPPTTLKRTAVVLGICAFGAAGTTAGCGWWKGNATTVSNDLLVLSECVISQVFKGVTDPVTIAAGCVGSAISDVEQILASLIDYYTGPQDGGAIGAEGMLCGSGDPPFKTAPKCISLAQAGHLHTAHAKAKAALR
jgi:hypothetical protein